MMGSSNEYCDKDHETTVKKKKNETDKSRGRYFCLSNGVFVMQKHLREGIPTTWELLMLISTPREF
jgi:hypothetical protein